MKTSMITGLLLFTPLFVVCDKSNPVKPSNNGTWQRVYQAPIQGYYWAMHFADETHGWAVGDNSTIFKSDNGGQAWTVVTPPPGVQTSFRSVYFFDENHGYLSGSDGGIWHTTNGGQTWTTQQSGTIFPVSSFQFFNQNDGWAICSNWALQTRNGGATWNRVTIPTEPDHSVVVFTSLFFLDETRGWAGGLNASSSLTPGLPICHTQDNGDTWQARVYFPSGSGILSIFFIDKYRGWSGSFDGILSTADGGHTWTLQSPDCVHCHDFCFTDDDHGWALSMGGGIYRFERE